MLFFREDTEDRLKPIVLSILKSILEKATNMSFDFLHWVFLNIAEPQKNSRKKAFNITMELIQSSEKDFEEFFTGVNILQFEFNLLILNKY